MNTFILHVAVFTFLPGYVCSFMSSLCYVCLDVSEGFTMVFHFNKNANWKGHLNEIFFVASLSLFCYFGVFTCCRNQLWLLNSSLPCIFHCLLRWTVIFSVKLGLSANVSCFASFQIFIRNLSFLVSKYIFAWWIIFSSKNCKIF